MGLGDWIMATAQIRDLHEQNQRPVIVMGIGGRVMWSEVFEYNPRVIRRAVRNCQILQNGPGLRPYIAAKNERRWFWKKWNISPGELYLTDEELASAEPFRGMIMIEPHTKISDGNKSWYWERWQAVRDSFEDQPFVQTGRDGVQYLDNVDGVVTTFRQAAAILSVCRAYVGPEGALHHAAAALGVPAVVLWSEFISPEITGYAEQRNIRHAGSVCGSRVPCVGCKLSMELITVEEVITALEAII